MINVEGNYKMNYYNNNNQICIKKPGEIVGWLTVEVKRANSDLWERVGDPSPVHNTFTNAGRDLAHAQMYTNTSAGTRGCGYIASSTEGTTPVAGDTDFGIGDFHKWPSTRRCWHKNTYWRNKHHTYRAYIHR